MEEYFFFSGLLLVVAKVEEKYFFFCELLLPLYIYKVGEECLVVSYGMMCVHRDIMVVKTSRLLLFKSKHILVNSMKVFNRAGEKRHNASQL